MRRAAWVIAALDLQVQGQLDEHVRDWARDFYRRRCPFCGHDDEGGPCFCSCPGDPHRRRPRLKLV